MTLVSRRTQILTCKKNQKNVLDPKYLAFGYGINLQRVNLQKGIYLTNHMSLLDKNARVRDAEESYRLTVSINAVHIRQRKLFLNLDWNLNRYSS